MLCPVARAMLASTNGAAVSSLANCSTLAGVLSHSASNSASALCTGTVIRGASPGQVLIRPLRRLDQLAHRHRRVRPVRAPAPPAAVRVNSGPNIT